MDPFADDLFGQHAAIRESRSMLVPFGKHRGKPVEVLMGDPSYVKWLRGQSWVSERFPALHTLIINHFGEPSETPEHNRLQLRFLDPLFLARCVRAVLPEDQASGYFLPMPIPVFEENGIDVWWRIQVWDVTPTMERTTAWTVLGERYTQHLSRFFAHWYGGSTSRTAYHVKQYLDQHGLKVLTHELCEGHSPWNVAVHVAEETMSLLCNAVNDAHCKRAWHVDITADEQYKQWRTSQGALIETQRRELDQARTICAAQMQQALSTLERSWDADRSFFQQTCVTQVLCPTPIPTFADDKRSFAIECKPTLGDDFPAVLRFLKGLGQQQNHKVHHAHVVVVIERLTAQGGSLDQIKTFFRQSGITLLTIAEIEAATPIQAVGFDSFVRGDIAPTETWWNVPLA